MDDATTVRLRHLETALFGIAPTLSVNGAIELRDACETAAFLNSEASAQQALNLFGHGGIFGHAVAMRAYLAGWFSVLESWAIRSSDVNVIDNVAELMVLIAETGQHKTDR